MSLISESQTLAAAPVTSFYGFDGHGSVRYLTSSTGAVTDTYDYDAFGNLISSTGSTPNKFLFAGEQFDPALGIYYNRARYYDQRQGRFWTMDTWEGDPESPGSLHRYLYTAASPVNRLDRSGHDFIDVIAAVQVIGISVAQSLPAVVPALTLVTTAANIYYFTTDPEYRNLLISAGPDVAVEALAADVRLITGTSASLFRHLKSVGIAANGLEQLAALRLDLNIAAANTADGSKTTLAKLVIGDADWFGISAHGQDVTLTVNPISASHAEADVIQQAANAKQLNPQRITDSGLLYIDRDICQACGLNGAVKSMARQVGLKHLTIIMPSGIVDWDLLEP